MNNTTPRFPTRKSEGLRKAICGAAAMVATAATLGLTVLAPIAAAPAEPMAQALDNTRQLAVRQAPAEVVIVPSRIDVIAIRTPHTDPVSAASVVRQRG